MWLRMVRATAELVHHLAGQNVARDNARAAATTLTRGRVEREEVELFLASLDAPPVTVPAQRRRVP